MSNSHILRTFLMLNKFMRQKHEAGIGKIKIKIIVKIIVKSVNSLNSNIFATNKICTGTKIICTLICDDKN